MESVERSITVTASIVRAFEPWLNVEGWSLFLKAVKQMRRIDETHFEMVVVRGGQENRSTAEITVVIPKRRIAWRTVSGAASSGMVCFQPLPDGGTEVHFKMLYHADTAWHKPDVLAERLEFHLACFKEFIEGPKQ